MIWVLFIGFMIGMVAKFFMPGNEPGGFVVTILLGIGGAMLATWAGKTFGAYNQDEPTSFIAAVLGAMAILFIYHLLSSRKKIV